MRYKYVGDQEGVELRHRGQSFVFKKGATDSVPFEIDRDDFELVKTTKEKA